VDLNAVKLLVVTVHLVFQEFPVDEDNIATLELPLAQQEFKKVDPVTQLKNVLSKHTAALLAVLPVLAVSNTSPALLDLAVTAPSIARREPTVQPLEVVVYVPEQQTMDKPVQYQ